ncbi:hypothetical protein [Natranaerofaba carboxydovora]|uniref:hypothetical protein n=1 Tax=Natranaerofaba carboxydovora TaxID=2742683 RepID=UPI001F12CF11|nr:hypothetical protein [Natranaerofaba carboxydovora]UMZ74729.1 hypothetical protein ACONDI_02329 [Natranaerofaba carboxydovora]
MKIGGDIFLNATQDFSDPAVKSFIRDAFEFLKKYLVSELNSARYVDVAEEFFEAEDQTFKKYGFNLRHPGKVALRDKLDDPESKFVFDFTRGLLFQSVRLACLLHDVGHFPYSHTVESAVSNYLRELFDTKDDIKGPEKQIFENCTEMINHFGAANLLDEGKLHEYISLKIIDEILPESKLTEFQYFSRLLAKKIINQGDVAEDEENIIHTLYEIASGEVDADRLDYTLRDPYSSGLELGKFDIERLLNNFTIARTEEDIYRILPKGQALSSIESFFHQRYLTHKYLIYHHGKVRMDQIVGKITEILIQIYFNNQKEEYEKIRLILMENGFDNLWSKINDYENTSNEGYEDYFYCDEGWFNNLIKTIFSQKEDLHNKDIKIINNLFLLIETFILRKTENIYSIFKRYDMYYKFFKDIYTKVNKEAKEDANFTDFKNRCSEIIQDDIDLILTEINDKHSDVVFLYKKILPKLLKWETKDETELKIVIDDNDGNTQLIPANEISPYIDSLKVVKNEERMFHMFLIGDNLKEQSEKIKEIYNDICESVKDKYIYKKNKEKGSES